MTFNNVLFDLYDLTWDDDRSVMIRATTPTLSGIEGHLENVVRGLESDVPDLRESERFPGFKLTVIITPQTEAYLRDGVYVKVTHKKDPWIKTFVEQTKQNQYIVQSVDDSFAAGLTRVLHLAIKNDA